MKRLLALLLIWVMLPLAALAQQPVETQVLVDGDTAITDVLLVEYGEYYYTPDEVALYLHAFCELPYNFLTKDEAYDLGWKSNKGNLWDVAYGMCIGGDEFGNREGRLPDAYDRYWYECDVNYNGGFRGAERLVFSSDGLIYYTADHYETFELLYENWYEAEYDDWYVQEDSYSDTFSFGGVWSW